MQEMFLEGKRCDMKIVILITDGDGDERRQCELPCHSLILEARSPYIRYVSWYHHQSIYTSLLTSSHLISPSYTSACLNGPYKESESMKIEITLADDQGKWPQGSRLCRNGLKAIFAPPLFSTISIHTYTPTYYHSCPRLLPTDQAELCPQLCGRWWTSSTQRRPTPPCFAGRRIRIHWYVCIYIRHNLASSSIVLTYLHTYQAQTVSVNASSALGKTWTSRKQCTAWTMCP